MFDNLDGSAPASVAQFGQTAVSAISPIVGAFLQQIMNNAQQSRQNAYNSPAAQMQRLKAAGLNPYAFQSQIAGINQQSKPTASANYQAMISDMFDNVNKIANIKAANNQAAKTEAETQGIILDNSLKQQSFDWRLQQIYLSAVKANLDNELQRGKITYQQYANQIKSLDYEWNKQLLTPIGDLYTQWKSGNISGMSPRMLSYLNMPFKNTAMYPLTYSGLQYDVWRKKIAWNYERQYNMPWTSNDTTMKFIRMAENAVYMATGKTVPELFKRAVDKWFGKDDDSPKWWEFRKRYRSPNYRYYVPKQRSEWRVPQSYPQPSFGNGPVFFPTPYE